MTFEQEVAYWRERSGIRTHSYVLAELVALDHARDMPRQGAIDYMPDLLNNPVIEILWMDALHHRSRSRTAFTSDRQRLLLVRSGHFLQMRQFNITEALTTDRHFERKGWRPLPHLTDMR